MLHHSILLYMSSSHCTSSKKTLMLHTDNCSGQNKYRFVVFYIFWPIIVGLEEEVSLYFLVGSHTKKVCDKAFGYVKRAWRRADVVVPKDTVTVPEKSASSTRIVVVSKVAWCSWKLVLEKHFVTPSKLKLSLFHVCVAQATAESGVAVRT